MSPARGFVLCDPALAIRFPPTADGGLLVDRIVISSNARLSALGNNGDKRHDCLASVVLARLAATVGADVSVRGRLGGGFDSKSG